MSDRQPLPTCKTCRFWIQGDPGYSEEIYHGECRRRAPVRILQDVPDVLNHWCGNAEERSASDMEYEPLRRVFPVTVRHDWCGEHQPATVADTPPAGT